MDITLLENNFKLYQGCKWELFIYLIKQHCWEGYLGKLVNFLFGSISKKKINARSNFVSHVLHFWVLFCLAFNMHPSLKRIKKTTTKIIKCKQAHKMCCRFFCVSLALTHSNKAFGSKKKDYGEKSEKKKNWKKEFCQTQGSLEDCRGHHESFSTQRAKSFKWIQCFSTADGPIKRWWKAVWR